ncbi:type IV secretory system conjugative DNA transfer family protein (plasmid) [Janibacter sp. G349]|uniref:type IV secretory system conjugative DNA transfer family protein n=1 Tax=Janibacter sp. G349 TaxID=3405424 RepID=UPI003D2DE4A8
MREDAKVIRPDLYGKKKKRSAHECFFSGSSPVRWAGRSGRRSGREARGGWVRWERTTGVIGPQGSGKTLGCLIPALLQAPGAALVTLTKPQDMLLSWTARSRRGPCVVLDPFGLTKGMPEMVFDPIDGCVDPQVAERRAKAWTAGTIKGGSQSGQSDDAARFYANEAAKVLQCYLHAAALTGADLDEVLEWVANPLGTSRPTDILRNHEYAAPHWPLLGGRCAGTRVPPATRPPPCTRQCPCSSRRRSAGGACPVPAGQPPTSLS